jgi:hypothetical protein
VCLFIADYWPPFLSHLHGDFTVADVGGGQTAKDPSGWTPDLINVRLNDKAEALDEKIESDRRSNRDRFLFVIAVVALGWNELQRRLVTLNHAHEQQVATLAATVTSDKYESDKTALDVRVTKVETGQAASEVRAATSEQAAARAEGAARSAREDQFGGRSEQRQQRALILSVAAIVVSIIVAVGLYYASHHGTTTICFNSQKVEIPC